MIWVGLLAASTLMAAACGDDANTPTDAATIDAVDAAEGCICDPVGAFPQQGALLNAPLKTDVEVLVRQPRHPGCAGPKNLP
ncbi:MAG: hypothetical protein H0T89_11005 [Deltaproteobacteria bacterium]|nr:hypothetical protein [Deltaproteobacteria bacterium]